MENILTTLKSKIENYYESKLNTPNDRLKKIENEITILETQIVEIKKSMTNKSKIEHMKARLEIASLETELAVKKMRLEEAKEVIEEEYEDEIEYLEKDLEIFILSREKKLERIIKDLGIKKEPPKEISALGMAFQPLFGPEDLEEDEEEEEMEEEDEEQKKIQITLTEELQEIKNYYQNVMKTEITKKQNLNKEIAALSGKLTVMFLSEEGINKKKNFITLRKICKKKIETTKLIIDDMIREVIEQLLIEKDIKLPLSIPESKYFSYKNTSLDNEE